MVSSQPQDRIRPRTTSRTGVPGRWLRHAGPGAVVALVVAYVVLWLLRWPSVDPPLSAVGQLLGAVSVLLLSLSLVLVSMLPLVEGWFDGIDRAAVWHRRLAIAGTTLLAAHIPLSANRDASAVGPLLGKIGVIGLVGLAAWGILPRWPSVVPAPLRAPIRDARDLPGVREVRKIFGGYDRWRLLHRTTGLFVAAGAVHGLLDGSVFGGDPVLRRSYVAVAGVGIVAYAYRELLARHLGALHDYEVAAVSPVGEGLTEIALRPLGQPVVHRPGQFALVYIEAKDGWHRHPFTIASAPGEDVVRVTVKALGDWTRDLGRLVEPGMPAVVGGPHGRFDHAKGTDRQVWVAGGVGVAPFLSWMRSLDEHPVRGRVDLFYTAAGPQVPFADELRSLAAGRDDVHVHVVDSTRGERLSVSSVLAAVDGPPSGLSVFLCGPEGLVRSFVSGFRDAGVRDHDLHREYFDWR